MDVGREWKEKGCQMKRGRCHGDIRLEEGCWEKLEGEGHGWERIEMEGWLEENKRGRMVGRKRKEKNGWDWARMRE